jgi:hypothetical protein
VIGRSLEAVDPDRTEALAVDVKALCILERLQ